MHFLTIRASNGTKTTAKFRFDLFKSNQDSPREISAASLSRIGTASLSRIGAAPLLRIGAATLLI